MKRLLYTLLFGALVISCEKDMNEGVIDLFVPSQEINFDAAKSTLENLMGVVKPIKGVRASSAKSGNSLRLVVWNTTGNSSYIDGNYAHVTSEEYADSACYDSYSPSTDWSFDWDTDNDVLTITIDDADTTYSITGDLATTYDTNFSSSLYFLARVASDGNGGFVVDGSQPTQVAAPTL